MTKRDKKSTKKVHELKRREVAIDRQVSDSFPASDPPSYSGGKPSAPRNSARATRPSPVRGP